MDSGLLNEEGGNSGSSGGNNRDQAKATKVDRVQLDSCKFDNQCCWHTRGTGNMIGIDLTLNKEKDFVFYHVEGNKLYLDKNRRNYICNRHHIIMHMVYHPSEATVHESQLTLDVLRRFCRKYNINEQGQEIGPYVSAVSRQLLAWSKSEKDQAVGVLIQYHLGQEAS